MWKYDHVTFHLLLIRTEKINHFFHLILINKTIWFVISSIFIEFELFVFIACGEPLTKYQIIFDCALWEMEIYREIWMNICFVERYYVCRHIESPFDPSNVFFLWLKIENVMLMRSDIRCSTLISARRSWMSRELLLLYTQLVGILNRLMFYVFS